VWPLVGVHVSAERSSFLQGMICCSRSGAYEEIYLLDIMPRSPLKVKLLSEENAASIFRAEE
jgi:arginine/ornithine N-succinyltransferase beta subunit